MSIYKGFWGLAITLALSLIFSVYLVTSTLQTIILKQGKISVKGYAERKITSDYAKWGGKLNARADNLPDAYKQLESNLEKVRSYIEKQGFDGKEFSISPVYTSLIYKQDEKGYATNIIEGYHLSYDLTIKSPKIESVKSLAEQIAELMKDGIEINSYRPEYFYTKFDELKIDLLGEAARDALVRASQLAANSKSQVGLLRSAAQGVFQITPLYSTTVSDYGENDTSTVEKSIKAVVTMEYGIY